MKQEIRSLTYEELQEMLGTLGEKPFRAGQIYEWVHQKLASSFEEMTNLSKPLRAKLAEAFVLEDVKEVTRQVSALDGTTKFLFALSDGALIESVLMRYHFGNSVCISSQVGCRMGCRFCASTIDGLDRSLTAGEMLGQIYGIQKLTGERVSNVVVMGSGEPLDNYENLVRFIRMLSDERGLHISQRNITVSTCGLTQNIRRLADEKLQITLAISLHAPNDEIRKTLMPVANSYTIDEVLEAVRYYLDQTGRRVTFEYSLIEGVNDSQANAAELAHRLSGLLAHVNLIPINPVRERNYRHSADARIQAFKNCLEKQGINVTIRREMGSDIDAACGQLRRRFAGSDGGNGESFHPGETPENCRTS